MVNLPPPTPAATASINRKVWAEDIDDTGGLAIRSSAAGWSDVTIDVKQFLRPNPNQ